MSFDLRIRNAPSGSNRWRADYSQGMVYSGWLDIDRTWHCPYGAYGAVDLSVWVVDADYDTRHLKYGLGPVYDGRSYIYDCADGILYAEVAFDFIVGYPTAVPA